MLDDQKPSEVVVDEELSQVTVDLDKKPVDDKPKDAKPSPDISKLNNTIAYQTRQLEKAMRELQEVRQQLASRQEPVREENQDEIDEIAQKDWKLGVKKVVEKDIEVKVQEILDKRDKALQEVQRKTMLESELDKSKKKVLERYPQVEDSDSEESQIYRQVINEDTTILSNVHGPEIAMYRMEERLRQMGRTPSSVKPIVDREVNRLVRAGASSVVGKAGPKGKITLTKEQEEFCKHYNVPYEVYAQNMKSQDSIGGVEA